MAIPPFSSAPAESLREFPFGIPAGVGLTVGSSNVSDSTNTQFITETSVECLTDGFGVNCYYPSYTAAGVSAYTAYQGESYNGAGVGAPEKSPSSDITVEFSVYNETTQSWMVATWGAEKALIRTISNGLGAWCNFVPIAVKRGTRIKYRTRVVRTTGTTVYTRSANFFNPAYTTTYSGASAAAIDASSITGSGSIYVAPATVNIMPYDSKVLPVAIIGDSTFNGITDIASAWNTLSYDRPGGIRRGLGALNVPAVSFATAGDYGFLNVLERTPKRAELLYQCGCRVAIINFGINDFSNYDSAEDCVAYNRKIAEALKRMGYKKVFGSTMMPRSGAGTPLYTDKSGSLPVLPSSPQIKKFNIIMRSDTKRPAVFDGVIDRGAKLGSDGIYADWDPTFHSGTCSALGTTTIVRVTAATLPTLTEVETTGRFIKAVVYRPNAIAGDQYRSITASTLTGGNVELTVATYTNAPTNGESIQIRFPYTDDGTHETTAGAIKASEAITDNSGFFRPATAYSYYAEPTYPAVSNTVIAKWIADPAYLFQDTARTTPVTTDGQAVASWVPQSGTLSTAYLEQATAGSQPVYKATAFNSAYKCVEFDGVADYLQYTGVVASAQPFTILVVGHFVTHSGNQNMYDGTGSSNRHQLLRSSGSFTIDSTSSEIPMRATPNDPPRSFVHVVNGANSFLIVSGESSTAVSTALTGGLTGFTVGAFRTGASQWANIRVAEMTILSGAISSLQAIGLAKARVDTYGLYDLNTDGYDTLAIA